jgi:[ribosomal protein S18]-alanine N-acetyltransferase
MSWRIVPAGPEAADQMASLHAQCFPVPWAANEFSSLLQAHGAFALLGWAHAGAHPGCLALAWAQSGEAEILTLGTLASQRRTGAGRALVQHVLVRAAAMGAQALVLEVAQTNLAARALYAGLGFCEIGRRKRYYSGPEGPIDALVLRRALG